MIKVNIVVKYSLARRLWHPSAHDAASVHRACSQHSMMESRLAIRPPHPNPPNPLNPGLIKSSAREQFSRFRFIARDLPLRPLRRNASRPKGQRREGFFLGKTGVSMN